MKQWNYAHLIWRGANEFSYLLYELKAYIHIQDPQNDKEPSGHGGTNDTTSPTKGAKLIANGGGSGSDYDRGDNHNTKIGGILSENGKREVAAFFFFFFFFFFG